jgi:hypothetical protein
MIFRYLKTKTREVNAASIIRAIVQASTSETSVNFYQTTRRNIPEDSHLHTHRRENLKSRHYFYLITINVTDYLTKNFD